MKKMISAEVVCICDQNYPQQVSQVRIKASNQEVDTLVTDHGDDVSQHLTIKFPSLYVRLFFLFEYFKAKHCTLMYVPVI